MALDVGNDRTGHDVKSWIAWRKWTERYFLPFSKLPVRLIRRKIKMEKESIFPMLYFIATS